MSVIRQLNGSTVHAHKLIVKTAKEMAHELYNSMMLNNERFEKWKKVCELYGDGSNLTPAQYEELFVNEVFPSLIEQSRATLAGLLEQPISKVLKDEILDALLKDAPFRAGRLKARGLTRR